MYRHNTDYLTTGAPAPVASGALVMLHGRGGTAANISTLADDLNVSDFAVYAPQAANKSWYPYSFMAPEDQNQPALDSTMDIIGNLVQQIEKDGILPGNIFFLGFSQGACAALEYVGRNAKRYGGVVAFTGGLIGEALISTRYTGDFEGTPILITTGDPDPHVPLGRVQDSAKILRQLNGEVTLQVYKGRPHTISLPEIELANRLIFAERTR
ncbi:phospholipase [Mucilaginibacter hurinus]|uniref:Phospholipase n=1 Tax=Mucilaginibacter hurinus TaxID=2201324 RepID=A0A367GM28_9SPHI|nr:dienelactone hydrolase family protein [Mucilaginibacter hurinus]RCH53743.1 phospholipase [Mucilaginibacter hurinus]